MTRKARRGVRPLRPPKYVFQPGPKQLVEGKHLHENRLVPITPDWLVEHETTNRTDPKPHRTIKIHFRHSDALEEFCRAFGLRVGPTTKHLWFSKEGLTTKP